MIRRFRSPFVLLAIASAGAASTQTPAPTQAPAPAAVLWATLSPNPRAPLARFQLSESPESVPAEGFAGKGKAVRAWLAPDRPLALAENGDALIGEFETPATVVGARLELGVADAGGAEMRVASAKAAATPEDSQTSFGLPLELAAEVAADGTLSVRVWREGKPVAGSAVVAQIPGVKGEFKGTSDAEGRCALPKVWGLGAIAIRAEVREATPGTFEGKGYAALRQTATLTLASAGAAAPKADPAAYAQLEKASNLRVSLPALVSGTLVVRTPDGKTLRAPFETGDPLSVETDGWPRAETLAAVDLVSGLFERRIADFARGDGRNPVTFGEGGRILLHDRADTTVLVRGDEIVETARTIGATRTVTTVLESVRTPEGKVLPRRFEVKSYDPAGRLLKTVAVQDEYVLVGDAWLPRLRRVATTEKGKTTTRETRFEGVKPVRREG